MLGKFHLVIFDRIGMLQFLSVQIADLCRFRFALLLLERVSRNMQRHWLVPIQNQSAAELKLFQKKPVKFAHHHHI